MNLEVNFTNQFKKDVKLASKQHRDLDLLFEIIKRLSNKETLEPKLNLMIIDCQVTIHYVENVI